MEIKVKKYPNGFIDAEFIVSFKEEIYYFTYDILFGGNNMRYNAITRQKCIEAVKAGVPLKAIKNTLGPNPKAVMRYLIEAGIDYKALKEKLKSEGKQRETFKRNGLQKRV